MAIGDCILMAALTGCDFVADSSDISVPGIGECGDVGLAVLGVIQETEQ